MSSDQIVIVVMALLFFGGIFFLAAKSRRDKKRENQLSSPTLAQTGEDHSPSPMPEKGRRKPK
jgi:hypothetical protein